MASESALKTYEMYHDAANKGEHLVTGLIAALVAFLWRDYTPAILGCNLPTLHLAGVVTLVGSLICAIYRHDRAPIFLALMSQDFGEEYTQSQLVNALSCGGTAIHDQLGIIGPEQMRAKLNEVVQTRKQLLSQLQAVNKQCGKLYRWRNRLLVAGLCIVGAAKVLTPYVQSIH